MEVAGDLGVEVGTVEGAVGKLLRTIKADPGVVKALGEEAILTEGGFVDANEAFLRAVDYLGQIKDPAEKAREGVRLFGKGWQQVAPLIEEGAERIRERLQAVSEQKIITREEFQRAKDFRDSLDDLKDNGEDLAIALGETLVPVLSDLFELLGKVFGVVKDVVGAVGNFGDKVADLTGAGGIKDVTEKIREFQAVGRLLGETVQTEIVANLEELSEETLPDVTYEWDSFLGELNRQDAFDGAKRSIAEVKQALADAFSGEAVDSAAFEGSVRDAQRRIGDVVDSLLEAGTLSRSEANAILFNLKVLGIEGLEYALALLENPALRIDSANISMRPNTVYVPGLGTFPARAGGGPVSAGMPYLVGERGPELFVPGASGNIVPNSRLGSGSTINVTVTSADPNEVVRALQTYVRQSGPVPVNTRAM